ncbi:glycosyltransferase [Cytobacillus pseudoceanisediminis]|uniref:glycosyltransferase n=1 Tax=Cytobacillus pseudoceanisediminis TaxID=3051614 RepID=UPI003C2B9B99
MFNSPFIFRGNEYIAEQFNPQHISDNFKYECVILPQRNVNNEIVSYLISPETNIDGNTAVAGILFQNSRLCVVEKYKNNVETVISLPINNNEWIKVVVVYLDKTPSLYINGKKVAEGAKSRYKHICPSLVLGGNIKNECFHGKIQSIKLLNVHQDIVWGHDFLSGTSYRDGKKSDHEVSIILPTFNKYQELLLTLHSLEFQHFDKRKYEVIIVDDGSKDHTSTIINEHNFSFDLKYIRSNQNIGRASMRNIGIQNASGRVIVFLDAEIIVKPDFVSLHYKGHKENKNIVICGSMVLKGLYTIYHPGYNLEQKSHVMNLLINYPSFTPGTLKEIESGKTVKLLTENEVKKQSYHKLSFDKPFVKVYKETLFSRYGNDLKGFHFPWLLFCTGNVSVEANAIREVGLFEEYPGYGWDDHELGYRLYKKGYRFLNHIGLAAYHQEHPIAKTNPQDAIKNFIRVFNKYPEVQLRIFILHFLGISVPNVHLIYDSYLNFLNRNSNIYREIPKLFEHILQRISVKLWNEEPLTNLLDDISVNKEQIMKNLEDLEKYPEVKPFASNFKNIIKI